MAVVFLCGGDERSLRLKGLLRQAGHSAASVGLDEGESRPQALEGVAGAGVLVLPVAGAGEGAIPALYGPAINPLDVLSRVGEGVPIVGGFGAWKPREGRGVVNLLECEEFLRDNAEATAQGALVLAAGGGRTLAGMRVMVLGCGRIGSRLAALFAACRADVTATYRSPAARAGIEALGCRAIPLDGVKNRLDGVDLLVNTIPARIFSGDDLTALPPGAVLMELASPPHCCSLEEAGRAGVNARAYPGIPGKMFPLSAAEYILKQLNPLLGKGGIL